jgi:trans-aconitate 2-methyltransferase
LFVKFRSMMTDRGVLAVQIPLFFEMPIGSSINRIAANPGWADRLAEVRGLFTIHSRCDYYDLLAPLFGSIDMWETEYVHVMDSPEAVLGMIRSTGLKPYLDRLAADEEKMEFEKQVLIAINEVYPSQHNGKTLFPFKRLFIIAGK